MQHSGGLLRTLSQLINPGIVGYKLIDGSRKSNHSCMRLSDASTGLCSLVHPPDSDRLLLCSRNGRVLLTLRWPADSIELTGCF